MNLCAVYKSTKKQDTYLYLPRKDDFSGVPDALMSHFGKPVFVMLIPLDKRKELARLDADRLLAAFEKEGFYLQLPPPPEDLLKQHKAQQKGNAQ